MRRAFRNFLSWVCLGGLWLAPGMGAEEAGPGPFVRLAPVAGLRLVGSAEAYPGGAYEASNLTDGVVRTEYSSDGKGTNTFLEFEFGGSTSVVAFRHVDRNDPATVASSELMFQDGSGALVSTVAVAHVNRRGGVTLFVLPAPVTATKVRWQVTGLGPQGHGTVGGAEMAFFTGGPSEALPRGMTVETRFDQVWEREKGTLLQPARVVIEYPYAQPVEATVRLGDTPLRTVRLEPGTQTLDYSLPGVPQETESSVAVMVAGQTAASRVFKRRPMRRWEIHILPHSHVDIGYTALQAEVEAKQNRNIERALELIRATAGYPQEARFKWNVEVLWPVENFLKVALPEQREAFLTAVREGSVGLDALYGNLLTGLCRPEELIRSVSYATRLSEICGVPIESAMISDVPGYTWSTVPALSHAGVKYFSFAPNYFDRMGGTMVTWQNKPFWWQGPDGRSRLLSWCPSRGYALGHILGEGEALTRFIPDYLLELEKQGYPYDLTHVRWSVHGDNGEPDEKISDAVRDWNVRHAYPRLRLSTTAETFAEFERRHGTQLPVQGGDYTPYWEDGAASSAQETALNRAAAERLVQAETLWVMRYPGAFPARLFQEAWRNVLLYSEHTWGAHNSVSQPDLPFVREQWRVKQGFALEADRQSRELLGQALGGSETPGQAVDVFNTCSWERTDLVTLPPELSRAGDRVRDERGRVVPAQRLRNGELAFLARGVPAFSSRRYRVEPGAAQVRGAVRADGVTLVHPDFTVRLDEQTGAIRSLQTRLTKADLVDPQAATALNDYFYVPGTNTHAPQRNGTARITVLETGPLLAALLVESDAPGCKHLRREVRVVDGLDRVELINTIDKQAVRAKEGLHFGFGFQVPRGVVRLDVGLAVVRPELDQMPASCKNWFSVQRWADISNDELGVTWATVDAPLVEVGGLTAALIGSQTDPSVWLQQLAPSQTIYSWVMNNHWHTNYRAEQEGPTVFRYMIRPHRGYSAMEAARFGMASSQPLLAAPATGPAPKTPRLTLSSPNVLVTAFKRSDDGRAWILRLFGASGLEEKVKLSWSDPKPKQVWLSDTSELPKEEAPRSVLVPPWGLVTLRADLMESSSQPID